MALFGVFPLLQSDTITIRNMTEQDVDALSAITGSECVYRYIYPFLYKKSRNMLLTAIRNLAGRDFDKKKWIIAGIYLREAPDKLIGLAEMFDYKKRASQMTIGYLFHEDYWHRGLATETIRLLRQYLLGEMGLAAVQAVVLPENRYSAKALEKNGFVRQPGGQQVKNWGGRDVAEAVVYRYTAQ